MKRKFVIGTPQPANQPQRQPSPQQIDAAQRILSHDHQRTYGQGAKGATIRAIQIFLASRGYEPGRFDGDWGDKTQAAWEQMKKDRGWSFDRATPEALASMSKEAGQPLPRQRPAQAGDMPPADVAGTAAAQPGLGPVPNMAMQGDASPPAPSFDPSPNSPHAMEREYDPNGNAIAAENRARVEDDPTRGYQQPIISPSPDQYGPDMRQLGAMQPAQPPPAPPSIPFANPSRFNAASEPVTSDAGVPDKLIEAMAARRGSGNPLRDALIGRDLLTGAPGGGRASPAQQAMAQALIARMAGR